MSDEPAPEEMLAAEYALGLLEGEELLAARGREASDPAFATEVAQWQERLAPLLDEISPATPREEVWLRISAELEGSGREADVISLKTRIRQWQLATGVAAAAAVAAFALLFTIPVQTNPPAPQAPLAASIPIGDTQLRLAVTYLPESEELLISASGLTADGVHDHELWLVPQSEDTPLLSLGVVAPGEERRIQLTPAVAAEMADGSGLVLTREPLGGKPRDADAGPVVAEGRMQKI
ncbi:anti-sigma factor [Qipengyuania sp. 1NDH17]|uniref:Anti-sigma factor n=1 Tax=Qipengyuania polymorpha TaxID=2867234 RepID=A0ABS7IWZ8_9SPHN|nr:anti-sigma factor [Qipengyuania polymorpha]MBX7458076.1 anti-sigma factor [Qipengyuania polymorpha]